MEVSGDHHRSKPHRLFSPPNLGRVTLASVVQVLDSVETDCDFVSLDCTD